MERYGYMIMNGTMEFDVVTIHCVKIHVCPGRLFQHTSRQQARGPVKPYASIRTMVTAQSLDVRQGHVPYHAEPVQGQMRDFPGTNPCPEGYRLQQYGGSRECVSVIHVHPKQTGSRVLDCLANPECGVSRRPSEVDIECPTGTHLVVLIGKLTCISDNARSVMPETFDSSNFYENDRIEQDIPSPFINVHDQLPAMDLPPYNGIRKCEPGEVPVISETGYICVEMEFQPSNCPEDMVAVKVRSGIQCIPCPPGAVPVSLNDGFRCDFLETATTPPCQDGLLAFDTAVGRICQYVPGTDDRQPDLADDHPNPCQRGEILIVSQAGSVCHTPVTNIDSAHAQNFGANMCDSGSVLVQTTQRFSCLQYNVPEYIFPMCGPNFVFAKLHHEYRCISQVDARIQCSEQEMLTQIDNSFQCIEKQPSMADSPYFESNYQATPCDDNEFYDSYNKVCVGARDDPVTNDNPVSCSRGQTFNPLTRTCVPGYPCLPGQSFGRLTGACVSATRCPYGQRLNRQMSGCTSTKSAKPCPAGEMLDVLNGLCIPVINSKMESGQTQCDHGQVVHIDETNKRHCISLQDASGLCGEGYMAVEDSSGFLCKVDRQRKPPSSSGQTLQPCNSGGSFRLCEVPVAILLNDCNPGCANGGECINRTCVCPAGVTGHACHLDLDECLTHQCDYKCENTFGSFHCVCPDGMVLDTDGVACKKVGCVQPCLNDGECRHGNCVCESGFEGKYCEIDEDECLSNGRRLCEYKCRNTHGSYQCLCPPGSRLNPDRRTCTSTICRYECRNGGVCRDQRCQCPKGFYGVNCQLDVNECREDSPCEQICDNGYGGYKCSCQQGYTLQSDGRTCRKM